MITIPMKVSASCLSDNVVIIDSNISASIVTIESELNIKYDTTEKPYYRGEYEITPSDEAQMLRTVNMVMARNVIVNPIPSNYGKVSWNGSNLTIE